MQKTYIHVYEYVMFRRCAHIDIQISESKQMHLNTSNIYILVCYSLHPKPMQRVQTTNKSNN